MKDEEEEIKHDINNENNIEELNSNNNENNIIEKNEIIEIKTEEKEPQIIINEEKSENNNSINLDQNNLEENKKKDINIQINLDNKNNNEDDLDGENISMINIDFEKEKIEKKKTEKKIGQKEEEDLEENMNKIIIEEQIEEIEIEEQKPEELNVDNFLFNDDNIDNLKYNKEYTDNDDDLHSRRLTARNNDDYLINGEEKDEDKNTDVLEENKLENVEDDDEGQNGDEKLFPFKIVGDTTKKSTILGNYNFRYLELDAVKGRLKRFYSSKDYPKKPKEIIDIRNFKLVEKQKIIKEYYDLQITYTESNKKGKQWDVIENYRFRHQECRNKWFESLLSLWKSILKGNPIKLTKNILCFVDDRLGIIQDIGRGNKQNKKKKPKIDLRKFKVLSLLGVGGFGTVFKVRHILTDKIYAMKVMNKNYVIKKKYLHYVVSEFEIMKKLAGFPFILDLHYCFQTANYLYLIIDYCPNGDFTKLESVNNPKLFFAEVILAFEYIHNKNIIYRDLKPENILLDETGHIKLCDFNLAKADMPKNKRADSFCGSPLYFSPEMVLNLGANYKCDIYGIGLLMYEIYVGYTAFSARNIHELYEKIKKNKINFDVPQLRGDIKDLIMRMCAKKPEDRIEIEDIKKHKYFSDIDFNKVLNKEYGNIETVKKGNRKNKTNVNEKNLSPKEKEILEKKKFMAQQKLLDEDTTLNVLTGKITLKEMMLDQTRHMKNRVRQFYYVKKEDIEKTEEFKLEVNGTNDISSLIMDQYDA